MDKDLLEEANKDFRELFEFRKELKFSKGFPEYETVYEQLKPYLEEIGFERIEENKGYPLVIIKRREYEE